jgi:hypothetical protein
MAHPPGFGRVEGGIVTPGGSVVVTGYEGGGGIVAVEGELVVSGGAPARVVAGEKGTRFAADRGFAADVVELVQAAPRKLISRSDNGMNRLRRSPMLSAFQYPVSRSQLNRCKGNAHRVRQPKT